MIAPVIDLEAAVEKYGPLVRKGVKQLWGITADTATQERILKALTDGRIPKEWFESLERVAQGWADDGPWDKAYTGSAVELYTAISASAELGYTWDGLRAADRIAIRNSMAELVVDITEQQRLSMKGTLEILLRPNVPYQSAFERLRQSVTLCNIESRWLNDRYDRIFSGALADGSTQQQALNLANKDNALYFRRLQNNRTERIIRTEVARAKGSGEMIAADQIMASGNVRAILKTWRRTAYNDNWPSSEQNDGHTVAYNQAFPSGDMYPNEINERCILEYTVMEN